MGLGALSTELRVAKMILTHFVWRANYLQIEALWKVKWAKSCDTRSSHLRPVWFWREDIICYVAECVQNTIPQMIRRERGLVCIGKTLYVKKRTMTIQRYPVLFLFTCSKNWRKTSIKTVLQQTTWATRIWTPLCYERRRRRGRTRHCVVLWWKAWLIRERWLQEMVWKTAPSLFPVSFVSYTFSPHSLAFSRTPLFPLPLSGFIKANHHQSACPQPPLPLPQS